MLRMVSSTFVVILTAWSHLGRLKVVDSFSPVTPHRFSVSNHILSSVRSNGDLTPTDSMNVVHHPYCDLPGDPSMIITTNVDLGEQKLGIMKAISKAIETHTGKPEAYIAVAINDKASVIFAGSDDPTALGCMYSIGAIAMESNGAITSAVTDALQAFGVEPGRIYINFFDVPRANVGWNRKTFAG